MYGAGADRLVTRAGMAPSSGLCAVVSAASGTINYPPRRRRCCCTSALHNEPCTQYPVLPLTVGGAGGGGGDGHAAVGGTKSGDERWCSSFRVSSEKRSVESDDPGRQLGEL